MTKLKLIAALLLALIVIVVVWQNTEAVETRILFATVTMPRAVLLLTAVLVGYALGLLTSLLWLRQAKRRRDESPGRPPGSEA